MLPYPGNYGIAMVAGIDPSGLNPGFMTFIMINENKWQFFKYRFVAAFTIGGGVLGEVV